MFSLHIVCSSAWTHAEETCSTSSHVSHQWLKQPWSSVVMLLQESLGLNSVRVEQVPDLIYSFTASSYRAVISLTDAPSQYFPSVWRKREWQYLWPCVDAVVAKQPSQNSMPTIHYSATLIKVWLCCLPCEAYRVRKPAAAVMYTIHTRSQSLL